MSAAETPAKRRWKPFVCPMCRMVFRVSSDYKLPGVVCTGCHHVLRLPSDDDPVADLVDPALQAAAAERMAAKSHENP